MKVVVTGIGLTGGFGTGVEDLARALDGGTGSIGSVTVTAAGSPVILPAFRAGTERLEDFIPRRSLRRVDHFSRMALLGACLALTDAGMLAADHRRTGLIVASGYGATATTIAFIDSIIGADDFCASPTHFANSLHNAAAANISMQLGITGPNLSVSQFGMSVPSALLTAQRWLVEKRVDRVLCGALDEVSELIGYLWFRRRGGNRETAMLPLRTGTDTDVIGEGAAFFLLSRVEESDTGYCTLEGVSTGSLYRGKPSLPDDAFVLIGADGRQATGVRYRDAVTPETSIGCYTPLYGSMPVGPAFDMAVAALSLRERQRYPAPWHSQSDFPAAAPGARSPLDFPRIACLALGDAGEFGLATLGPL